MQPRGWNLQAVSRVEHTLSDQRPIRGAFNRHLTRQEFAFDMHYDLELGIVCSGSMRREYEGWHSNLGPGQVWLCGMWEPHGYKVLRAPCEVLVIVLLPQMLVNLRLDEAPDFKWLAPFTIPPQRRTAIDRRGRRHILDLAERFRRAMQQPEPLRALWQRVLLMETLLSLKSEWQIPGAEELPPSFYGRVNRAVQMVFKSRTMVTAQEAAQACGMSRNYFNRIFQSLMGVSFAKFALRYRLSSAAAQLLRTEDAVKSIAAEWGFTDASHLHHCFQQHYGCSPAEYRNRAPRSQSLESLPPAATPDGVAGPAGVPWNAVVK